MKQALSFAALMATMPIAAAQSPIVGIDLRGTDHTFTSDDADFLNNWVAGPNTTGQVVYALDFDATATTLYGINYNTSEYGTLDVTTGAFTTLGTTNLPLASARGLTAHPNGTDWYVIADAGSDNQLWVGDITTGVFTSVGITAISQSLIDIACDSQGNLFAHSITDDNLYSLDPVTGAETIIGPLGADINFAQGMDFDWSTDTLYATLYTGGGTGQFVSLDTTTGGILTTVATDFLNAEMEMAVQVAAGADPGVGTPFCDPMDVNSTGMSTQMTASMSAPGGSGLHLEAVNGPVSEFGYFLVGTAPDDPGLVISNGRLCLSITGGNVFGRYNVTGGSFNSIGAFDASGVMQNLVGTSSVGSGYDVPSTVPIPGSPTISAGSTWHFQLWHRDTPAGAGASNFSNGLSVMF